MTNRTLHQILIVDDSPPARELYRRYLTRDNEATYEILEATSVKSALALCDRHRPDLILLDYWLPDENGLVFLEEWRVRYGDVPAPVIMLTGRGNEQVAVAAMKQGAQDYLIKGVLTPEQLCRTVHSVIERLNLLEQLEQKRKHQQLVSAIALRIWQSLNSDTVLQTAVQEVLELLQTDRVLIYRVWPNGAGTVVTETVMSDYPSILHQSFAVEVFPPTQHEFYCRGNILTINDVNHDELSPCVLDFVKSFGVQAKLVVPILQNDRGTDVLWGLLIVHHCRAPRQWRPWEVDVLKQLAVQLAIAIQQTELYQHLQSLNASLEQQVTERTEALVASEQRFRGIFDNSFQFIGLLAPDGTLLEINQTALEFGGIHRDAVVYRPFWEASWWQLSPAIQTQLQQAIARAAQGEFVRYEVDVAGKDHQVATIDFSLRPLWNDTGNVILLIPEGRDVSDRKRAERALQELNQSLELKVEERTAELRASETQIRAMIEAIPDLLLRVSLDHMSDHIEPLNQPETFFPIHKHLAEVLPVELMDQQFERVRQAIETRELQVYERHFYKNTRLVYEEVRITAINDHEALLMVRDVTERQQAELALKESQRFIQQIADASPNILYLYDVQEQRNVYINRDITTVLGYPPSEVSAVDAEILRCFIHPEDVQRYADHVAHLHQSPDHTILDVEYRLRHANGEWHWFFSREAVFRRTATGHVQQTIGTAQDISDRKQIEEQLRHNEGQLRNLSERLTLALQSGNFGSWEYDFVRSRQIWDDRMYKLYGLSPEEFPGTLEGWLECVHPDDRNRLLDIQSEYDTEFRIIHPTGEIRYLKAHGIVQSNDQQEPIRMIGINYDITEQKQVEEELRRVNDQLTLTNAELYRATRLKDEFLANMSHELRTPLNAILGMSEVLQDGVLGPLNERQKGALMSVERSGQHLLALINDILDLAKVESGKLELQLAPVEINYLCTSSLNFVRQQAIAKNIQISTELPFGLPEIVVDELRIRQVLINLLSNAVKFTPDGGQVRLVVREERSPDQRYLSFQIFDTGIGIAAQDLDTLFQPFTQIDSRLNRRHAGTGLGLSVVRRLVELHQGTVAVTSEVHQGSCFSFCLPYCIPDHPAITAAYLRNDTGSGGIRATVEVFPTTQSQTLTSTSMQAPGNALILLVEDNDMNAMTISNYLEAKGYRLVFAKNGKEAVVQAKTHGPDLILMDIQMPEMDGLEAISQIRDNPDLAQVPIIAVTALAMEGDRDKCLATGANDYMTKPIKLKQLVHTIQGWLPFR